MLAALLLFFELALSGTAASGVGVPVASFARNVMGAPLMLAWVELLGVFEAREAACGIGMALLVYGVAGLFLALCSLLGAPPILAAATYSLICLANAACLLRTWRRLADARRPELEALAPSREETVAASVLNVSYGILFGMMRVLACVIGYETWAFAGFAASSVLVVLCFALAGGNAGLPRVMRFLPALPAVCCLGSVFLDAALPWLAASLLYVALSFQAFFVITVFTDVSLHRKGNPLGNGGAAGAAFALGVLGGTMLCRAPIVAGQLDPGRTGLASFAAVVLAATLLVALACLPNDGRASSSWEMSALFEPRREPTYLERGCSRVAEAFSLTQREREVLELLAHGRDQEHIQRTLVISANTAKTHIYHVLKKTGTHSRQELISLVEQEDKA